MYDAFGWKFLCDARKPWSRSEPRFKGDSGNGEKRTHLGDTVILVNFRIVLPHRKRIVCAIYVEEAAVKW